MNSSTTDDAAVATPPGTSALIPYVHVADLTRSIEFYRLVGLELEETHAAGGTTVWASLRNATSRLFLILAEAPIDAGAQAILFYLWTTDVGAMREHLMAHHIPVGALTFPPYMPRGEIRLTDPDGYVLLIGQRSG
jgi:hypothetical protein